MTGLRRALDEADLHLEVLVMVVAVFVVALAPRLFAPARFVTWDEPVWAERSLSFLKALFYDDPAGTFQREHPGVVTMWAGALSAAMDDPQSRALSRTIGRSIGNLGQHLDPKSVYGQLWSDWRRYLDPMRGAIAVLTALAIAAAWWLLRPLVGARAATTAAALLAFDPYLLAHSRVLHLDAVAASLGLVAVLLIARWLARTTPDRDEPWLLATGVVVGLAVLEKSPMFVLGAFVGAVVTVRIAADAWRGRADADRGGGAGRWLRAAIALAGAAVLTYLVAWPAMRVAPGETVRQMLAYAAEGAGQAREAVFFAGRVTPDPGIALYLAAIPWRMTPLSLVGAVIGVAVAVREARRGRWTAAVLLAWAAVFVILMGLGAKKFERYMLPALPALDVVAAVGLAAVVEAVVKGVDGARRRGAIALAAAVALQSVFVLAHHPYYLAWYNPLLGGGPAAARMLPVGWGEGSDQVVDWLNDHPGADGGPAVVATASDTLIAHRFEGTVVPPKRWRDADWLVVMVDDRQIGEPEEILAAVGDRAPEHVVRLNGIEYGWIWAGR